MKKYLLFIFISLFISFSACDYFESDNPTDISRVELSITNLQQLPDSLTYVGWILSNSDSSIKIFESNADANGTITTSSTSDFFGLHRAQRFIVTIETASAVPDSFGTPGNTIVLQGRFTLGSAVIGVGDGNRIASSTGIYSITTPTDTLDNDQSGIWFVDSLSRAAGPIAGLTLPVLYEGWVYEGLIIINNDTLSTGQFTDPKLADDFSGYSGTAPEFPFPGEDFLVNPDPGFTFPLDLSNAQVVINLTFSGDNISGPFTYNIFEATVPAGVQSNSTHQLSNTNAQVPGGMVSVIIDIVE